MDKTERREAYRRKLLDPRWQKRRLEILSRDEFTCRICFDTTSTLHVHHRMYINCEPWEYHDQLLVTLCENCHERETADGSSAGWALINEMKAAGFFTSDLKDLQGSIQAARLDAIQEGRPILCHLPEVVMSAICWLFEDPAAQRRFVDEYFASIHTKQATEKAMEDSADGEDQES